jgi:hypothetical protein
MLIDMTRLTRASQEARFRAWQIATGNKPWMMPSEVRFEEGMAPNDAIDTMEEARVDSVEAGAQGLQQAQQQAEQQPAEETVNA